MTMSHVSDLRKPGKRSGWTSAAAGVQRLPVHSRRDQKRRWIRSPLKDICQVPINRRDAHRRASLSSRCRRSEDWGSRTPASGWRRWSASSPRGCSRAPTRRRSTPRNPAPRHPARASQSCWDLHSPPASVPLMKEDGRQFG